MNNNWNALLAQHQLQQHVLDGTQPELFLSPLTDIGITTLVGEQTQEYLQGQLTNDIYQLIGTNYLKAAHCDAKGKAWAVLDVFTIEEQYCLCAHSSELEASTTQLQKYGVFAKTTISNNSDSWYVFGLGGAQAANWLADTYQTTFEGDVSAADIPAGKVLKRCKNSYLVVTSEPESLLNSLADKLYDHNLWDYWNIVAAIPYLTKESSGQYVPQMLNLQCLNAISFDKGCYAGQEMVARMKYLGKNKRATYILEGKASSIPADGHELQLSLGDNWRRSGQVLNHAGTADNLYLLAVLPNDLSSDALLRLKDDESSALTLKPLPYAIDAE